MTIARSLNPFQCIIMVIDNPSNFIFLNDTVHEQACRGICAFPFNYMQKSSTLFFFKSVELFGQVSLEYIQQQ